MTNEKSKIQNTDTDLILNKYLRVKIIWQMKILALELITMVLIFEGPKILEIIANIGVIKLFASQSIFYLLRKILLAIFTVILIIEAIRYTGIIKRINIETNNKLKSEQSDELFSALLIATIIFTCLILIK